jgi:hypothetical protein
VGEQNPNLSTTPVLLSATITDAQDGSFGDIRNAMVKFYDVNTLADLSAGSHPDWFMPGDNTSRELLLSCGMHRFQPRVTKVIPLASW